MFLQPQCQDDCFRCICYLLFRSLPTPIVSTLFDSTITIIIIIIIIIEYKLQV